MAMEHITVATFNRRGLSDNIKNVNVSKELHLYKVDVCSIQRTKI